MLHIELIREDSPFETATGLALGHCLSEQYFHTIRICTTSEHRIVVLAHELGHAIAEELDLMTDDGKTNEQVADYFGYILLAETQCQEAYILYNRWKRGYPEYQGDLCCWKDIKSHIKKRIKYKAFLKEYLPEFNHLKQQLE